MTEERIESFVEEALDRLEETSELSGRNVQLRIVEPFLAVLGWDIRSKEVEAGWPPDRDDGLDYVLRTDDTPAVGVEVDGTHTTVDETTVRTVTSRLDRFDLDWGIYSNGRQFVFIGRSGGEWGCRSCRLESLPERTAVVAEYTRTKVADRVGNEEQLRTAADRLRSERASLAEAVADGFEAVAGEAVRDDLERIATDVVDDAIDRLDPDVEEKDSTATGRRTERAGSHTSAEKQPPTHASSDERSRRGTEQSDGQSRSRATDRSNSQRRSATRTEQPDGSSTTGDAGKSSEQSDEASTARDYGGTTDPFAGSSADPGETTGSQPATDGELHESGGQPGENEPGADRSSGDSEDRNGSSQNRSGASQNRADRRADAGGRSAVAVDAASDAPQSKEGATEHPPENDTVPEQSDSEYVVRFFGGSSTVGAVGNPTPGGTLAGVFVYLGEQRALTNRIDTPWGIDEQRAIVARRPQHPDGTAMEAVREVGDYYVWTGGSTETCRRAIEELADLVGLRVMFQGDW